MNKTFTNFGSKNHLSRVVDSTNKDFAKKSTFSKFGTVLNLMMIAAVLALSTSAKAIAATNIASDAKVESDNFIDQVICKASAYSIVATEFDFEELQRRGVNPKVIKILQAQAYNDAGAQIPADLNVQPLTIDQQVIVASNLSLAYDIKRMELIEAGYKEIEIDQFLTEVFGRGLLNQLGYNLATIDPDIIQA